MSVRPATAADVAAIAAVARRAYAKYVPRIGREPAPMVADFAAHVARGETAVIVTGGDIVGYMVAYPRPDDYFVENVAVDPDAAGAGLGRALMAHAEDAARRAGRTRMRLYTNVRMDENFPFYERLGYLRTHEAEEDGFHRVYFEKTLERP